MIRWVRWESVASSRREETTWHATPSCDVTGSESKNSSVRYRVPTPNAVTLFLRRRIQLKKPTGRTVVMLERCCAIPGRTLSIGSHARTEESRRSSLCDALTIDSYRSHCFHPARWRSSRAVLFWFLNYCVFKFPFRRALHTFSVILCALHIGLIFSTKCIQNVSECL